ncbi:zinc-binding dehydrogenase [uncultured Senegalimassilia sp.]|uniref:zinc-binding dehydrogenase n=1 Tax=uncultured Senegalimassilia sp. TaxID=1714350 RepID=UPI0027DD0689|nr:zinc-binding dehydrogenase [uncultured Senegalimassilia sp.]
MARRRGAMRAYDYKNGLSGILEGYYDAVFAVNGKYSAGEYARLLWRGGTYVAVGMDSIRPALGMPIRGKRPRLAIFLAEMNGGGLEEAVRRAASSSRSIAITAHEGLETAPAALAELANAHDGTRHVVLI